MNTSTPILGRLFAILLVAAGIPSASGALLVFTDGSPQSLSDATGGAGPHSPATTTSNLSVSIPVAFGNTQDLDVRVSVNHSNVRQLRIILEAPDGATATLLETGVNSAGNFILGAQSASGANLQGTFFDADTYRSILDGDSPYVSRFQALELGSIERRTPTDASGTWKLRVTDYRAGDTGTLVTWSLSFRNASTQTHTVTNLNDNGAGSLRSAVNQANLNAGTNNIRLDPALTSGTINLTTGPIEIVSDLFATTRLEFDRAPNVVIRSVGNSGRIFTVAAGAFTVSDVTIADGISTGPEGGGGIFNTGFLAVYGCTIRNNTATYAGGTARGGGIANLGNIVVHSTTLSGNTAESGGAIYSSQQAILNFCTLSGNSAANTGAGSGGGIHVADGIIYVRRSTISGNSADGLGGGIRNRPAGTVELEGNIVAKNNAPAGPDLHGGDFTASFNLIGNTSDATLTDNGFNKTGTSAAPLDPMLGPLQNNGGTTETMALLFGSPALDSGLADPAYVYDQRGFLRPVDLSSAPNLPDPNVAHDMGAFELSPAVFANISTRLQVETGENVLIGGFIVTTSSGKATKKVLLRGLGLSLQAFGVAGALNDPVLELHNNQGLLALNDNWRDSQPQEIEATTIPPPNEVESAIVRHLAAGPHTAILRGKEGTTGVGLVELYDLEIDSPMIANISTRGFVSGGDKVMIAGFILSEINRLSGLDRARILLRGIGPSLAAVGIGQPLADPFLELFDGQGSKITENNNWQDTQASAIAATGAAPSDAAESAILIDLPAGNYTAVVTGVNGSIGVGLVEAYNIR